MFQGRVQRADTRQTEEMAGNRPVGATGIPLHGDTLGNGEAPPLASKKLLDIALGERVLDVKSMVKSMVRIGRSG